MRQGGDEPQVFHQLALAVSPGGAERGFWDAGADVVDKQSALARILEAVHMAPTGGRAHRLVRGDVGELVARDVAVGEVARDPLLARGETEHGGAIAYRRRFACHPHRQEPGGKAGHRAWAGVPAPNGVAVDGEGVLGVDAHGILPGLYMQVLR